MKNLFSILIFATILIISNGNTFIRQDSYLVTNNKTFNDDKLKDCRYKGFKLYGKVKIVNNFPDIKVKIVENFPDLKVKIVNNFPDDCGKWQFVDNFPDIKVQFVENFPDIKVKFVENFPGQP